MRHVEVEVWSMVLVHPLTEDPGLLALGFPYPDLRPGHRQGLRDALALQQLTDEPPFPVLQELELADLHNQDTLCERTPPCQIPRWKPG